MGNCILKVCEFKSGDEDGHIHLQRQFQATSSQDDDHHHIATIKVVTPNGGVMELYDPIIADHITSEFPGHVLFRSPDPTHSPPLVQKDRLYPGQLYYLLPLTTDNNKTASKTDSNIATPYRMSYDAPRPMVLKGSNPDGVPKYRGSGVWKVRLVINPEQLSEILSQDARTEELMDSVRTVAKCATAGEYCRSSNLSGCAVQRTPLHP